MPPSIERIRAIRARAAAGREVTLIYGAETATGLKGGITEDRSWEIQGYLDEYNISVWVDADAFEAELKSRQTISVDGEIRRILGVKPDSVGALIRLDLGARYAG
ncbi:MAG: hypothetical protein PHV82_03175 [Victivallaceae bacterium]|nr:hypothetical protein [Victivallaceae bacterium]